MPLAEVVSIEVGASIAKYILKLWLKDSSLGNDIASGVIDILKSKTSDKLAQRRGNRQFEITGEKVGTVLLPFFEREGAKLDEGDCTSVAYTVAESFDQSKLSSELLVRYNLQPTHLAQHILATSPTVTTGFSAVATELYKRIINESSTYIVEIASQLPSFTENSFAEVLKREDLIIERVDRILAELQKIRKQLDPTIEAEHFEIEYRQAVAHNLDILRLIGAAFSLASCRHKLSVAYITLSVAQNRDQSSTINAIQDRDVQDDIEDDIVSVNAALAHSHRLLVRGEAGSGKTTLLQWIAVRAATRTFEGELADWNNYLPFYIRLRQYAQSQFPAPEAFPHFAAQAIAGTMPKGWVHTKLRSGKAIVLIDGIDEVPATQREEVHTWLHDLVETFPQAHFIVTSRPYAIQEGWMTHKPFENAELQPMELSDISAFIDHWHQAVREELQREEEKNELEPLANYLKRQVQQNHTLRNLAASPLLCAMLCALSRKRNRHLPVNRIELYKACCQLLLERREKESRIDLSDYPPLTLHQKERILQDLAYWMIQEQLSEADIAQVDERIAQQLAHMPNLPLETSPTMVRRQLVERSSLLREPAEKKIDFAHRTFEEFFAAQAALDASDIEKLIANAHNVQWREVIILAAGLASKTMCEQLITGLIKRGDEERQHHHQLHLLAVSCLETAIQLQPEIKTEVEQRLRDLIPPSNMTEARAIAAAGELAVKHLVKRGWYSATICAACVRSLSLIGSDAALSMLESYATDVRGTVIKELLRAWSSFDKELYTKRILQNTFKELLRARNPFDKELYIKQRILQNTFHVQLEVILSNNDFQHSTKRYKLTVSRYWPLADLNLLILWIPLVYLTNVAQLDLSGCYWISDLNPLAYLTGVTQLNLSWCEQLSDLSPLAHLTNLTQLDLPECGRLTDLSPLAYLHNLLQLNLSACGQLTDLSPLAHLANLTQLDLSGCEQLIDLSPLEHLTNLTQLYLFGCDQLTDLSPLQELNKLHIIRGLEFPDDYELPDIEIL